MKNGQLMIVDPENMGIETLCMQLCAILAEITKIINSLVYVKTVIIIIIIIIT